MLNLWEQLGLYFGVATIAQISLLAFLIAAIFSIIVLITRLITKNKDEYIPFGPFLAMSAMMLIIVGVAFIYIENKNVNKLPKVNKMIELTYKDALIIGLFQVIAAIFPGTSRSGATILGALMIGIKRSVAAEFTFYLAIPVMAGASLLKIIKYGLGFTFLEFILLFAGMLVAFITSLFVIRFLMTYIKKRDFKVFGYYRIVLGIIVLLSFLI